MKWYRLQRLILVPAVALALLLSAAHSLAASFAPPDFSVHRLEGTRPGNTLLIIGGIQGDEPGGFNAASLIATQYTILSGTVWVVPNLNFLSIIKRSRGVHGDLNRKFDRLHPADPEFNTISRIKKLIADPRVDLVLNLHDGSGFYRHEYIDKMQHPGRWGQCIIIDQDRMDSGPFSHLEKTALRSIDHVNQHLIKKGEYFLVKNTRTGKGNREMAKTLTWFAIKNNKAAFGIEASKSFLTPKRTYYHLLAIESFFNQAGIEFQRRFKLTQRDIKRAIDADIKVALNNNKILLTIENVRKRLRFIPLQKNHPFEFTVNNPLMTIIPAGDTFSIIHGNRRMTYLSPEYLDYDFSLEAVEMEIDGQTQTVPFGRVIPVKDWFKVRAPDHHRVNIIGFTKKNQPNESGLRVKKEQIRPGFSVDKNGTIFRVEVYKDKKFTGMILVDFSGRQKPELKVALKERLPHPSKKLF